MEIYHHHPLMRPWRHRFKIDGIVWKFVDSGQNTPPAKGFKIDGIVWKLDIYYEVQPQTEKALK